MHLVFAVFKYFPYGGLQKDLVAIAEQCVHRGHRVTVYCRQWQGDSVAGIDVVVLPVKALSNHRRDQRFVEALTAALEPLDYDWLVGFNKMPGLDFYYAADSCYRAKVMRERSFLSRLTARFRLYGGYEQAVFGGNTDVLMISSKEIPVFRHYYHTADSHLHLLPPGIRRDRIMPPDYTNQRQQFRRQWQLAPEDKLILMVGSGFRTKGLDRAIAALAALAPEQLERSWLYVIGQDNSKPFIDQARRVGVEQRLRFLQGRDDIPAFLWGADLLIHPAYRENTGTVLLEAMVAGLPVLTTDVCGYAHYVEDRAMGVVLASPFDQSALDRALADMLFGVAEHWRDRGRRFAAEADIYSMPERAAQLIETLAVNRDSGTA
jgi:UDP-glucose:(heptosyl)LPS alpha-1,3-glucosyltransferase